MSSAQYAYRMALADGFDGLLRGVVLPVMHFGVVPTQGLYLERPGPGESTFTLTIFTGGTVAHQQRNRVAKMLIGNNHVSLLWLSPLARSPKYIKIDAWSATKRRPALWARWRKTQK